MPGDSKNRGELGEIRTQLAALSSHPSGNRIDAANAKKELFKKIINYTTVGIDMSSLFMPVMTSAVSSSEDIVLKKMLYLYICTYAQANPDLTLLTINLLTKDCRDQDPTIRGLALRSLCSLRVANLIEYLVSLLCGSSVMTWMSSAEHTGHLQLGQLAGVPYPNGPQRCTSICAADCSHGSPEGVQYGRGLRAEFRSSPCYWMMAADAVRRSVVGQTKSHTTNWAFNHRVKAYVHWVYQQSQMWDGDLHHQGAKQYVARPLG